MSNQRSHSSGEGAYKPGCFETGMLVILSGLFILATLFALFSFNFRRTVFNPPLVKEIISEEILASDLLSTIVNDISAQQSQANSPQGEPDIWSLLSAVGSNNRLAIQKMILPDFLIINLTDRTVDAMYRWVDSDDPLPQFSWDMNVVKERLAGSQGREALLLALNALPECNQEEVNSLLNPTANPESAALASNRLCRLPEPWVEQQINAFNTGLLALNQRIPVSYDSNQMFSETVNTSRANSIKTTIRGFRFLGGWGWVMPLTLLGLMAILGVRSIDTAVGWLGIPVMISGMLLLAMAVVSRVIFLSGVSNHLDLPLSPPLNAVVDASFFRVLGHILQPMLWQGALMLAIGAVALFLLVILRAVKIG